jgi:hypothetical protein
MKTLLLFSSVYGIILHTVLYILYILYIVYSTYLVFIPKYKFGMLLLIVTILLLFSTIFKQIVKK